MKNKFYLIFCLLLLTYVGVMAQSVEINPVSSSSAIISSTSTNKGLLVPRMTAAQRMAISSPSRGLMVYQTDFAINEPEGLYIFIGYWATIEEPALGIFEENGKTGYRLRNRSISFYGNIGNAAMDLSISSIFGGSSGATGNNSFATGLNTTASGIYSTAMGVSSFATGQSSTSFGSFSKAVGNSSIAAGNEVLAKSFGELAVGTFNDTLTTVNSTTFAGDNNRIFTVGTGSSGAARRTSFVVQQNGNVGIGASSPNAQLQLGNTITNRKLVLYEVANNDHQYYGVGINNQILRYQVDQTISSHAFYAGASETASNELMRITGSGNVGIGTTTPNAPLQFSNAAANRKIVLFDANNNDHQYFGLGINASMLRYQVDNTIGVHAFFAGASASTSTELMRIAGNGNVGIGTIAPSEKLHVAGSVKIVDGTQGAGKVLTSDANGKATWTIPAAGGNTSELQKITEGSNTGWRILGKDPANYGNIGSNALDLSTSTTASTTRGATGTNAFATGINTTASGLYATAMGESTTATGAASTVMGFNTTASNQHSTAMGASTTASGPSSTAIGNTTTASGPHSTSMGIGTRATQYASTAMGAGSRATGVVSTAIGNELIAKSATEFVVGSFNDTLTTVNSTAYVGDNNRTFTVGTGSSNSARRTSFVVQQNGNVGIGSSSPNAPLQFASTDARRKIVLSEAFNNDNQFKGFGVFGGFLRYQVDKTSDVHAFFAGTSATNSNELMRITGTGNVGIGTQVPSQRLEVSGNILASGTVTQSSDLRFKKNFSKIENPLNKVLALNGLHYDWRVEEFKENNFTKDRQIGFIAQEIEKIFPEMVLTDAKGYKSVDYARLTPVLVEAIKELKTLNDELKDKNEKLEANGQKIEARLNKIEALLYK